MTFRMFDENVLNREFNPTTLNTAPVEENQSTGHRRLPSFDI